MAFRFYPASPVKKILQDSLNSRREDLRPTSEVIEIVKAADEYASFLKKMMECVKDSGRRIRIGLSFERMENLFNYATIEQIENIVLPEFIPFLEKYIDYYAYDVYQAMPSIFNKVSLECLETLLPKLFKLYEQEQVATVSYVFEKLLLICIERMNAKVVEEKIIPELLKLYKEPKICALKQKYAGTLITKCIKKMSPDALQSLQLHLESQFFGLESSKDKTCFELIYKDILFVPYLALISRLNKNDNDKISERLLKHLSINLDNDTLDLDNGTADHILTFLKALRCEKIYVNKVFFEAVEKIVSDKNENFLQNNDTYSLFVSHMTSKQVEYSIEHKMNIPLEKFFTLPMEIYPIESRMKSLEFLQKHFDEKDAINSLTNCLKTGDFSDPKFRNILIQFAQHALKNMESLCRARQDKNKVAYRELLESCTSIMTDEELITYILPKVRQILGIDTVLIESIKECLAQVFSQIKDVNICNEFFNYFLTLYLQEEVCSNLLRILSEKVDSKTLSSAYRNVLHSDHSGLSLDRHAYLLALFSRHIPQPVNEIHPEETKEVRPTIKRPGRSCTVM